MTRFKPLGIGLITIGLLLLGVSCKLHLPTNSTGLSKSATVVMKASAGSSAALSNSPVTGGDLNIQTAMINVARFRIEENSGFDGEQQGEHNDGNKGGPDNEQDAQDIIMTGPYSLDISNNEAFIDSVAVYPGTFRKVDITFATSPFNGKSIVITGKFTPTGSAAIPFELKSEFSKEIQTQIAGNGITVGSNTSVPIVVTFNLAEWFGNVNFQTAQMVNGAILIDNAHNTNLLSAFESNLSAQAEMEDHSGEK